MWRFLLSPLSRSRSRPCSRIRPRWKFWARLAFWANGKSLAKRALRAGRGGEEYVGPIQLKHSGICTTDGPEQKSGEIRFRLSGASRIRATLTIDGVECSYPGKKSDAFKGR